MSRKQKTEAKKKQRSTTALSRYEAGLGSKNKLAELMKATGVAKSKREAQRIIQDVYEGKRLLSEREKRTLAKVTTQASKEEARSYIENVQKPREQRAKVTNTKKATKPFMDQLAADDRGKWIKKSMEKGDGRKVQRTFEDGVVQLAGASPKSNYAILIGRVENYGSAPGQSIKMYSYLIRTPTKKGMREMYRGFDKMTTKQKEEFFRDMFHDMTKEGRGELMAFYYSDKPGRRKEEDED